MPELDAHINLVRFCFRVSVRRKISCLSFLCSISSRSVKIVIYMFGAQKQGNKHDRIVHEMNNLNRFVSALIRVECSSQHRLRTGQVFHFLVFFLDRSCLVSNIFFFLLRYFFFFEVLFFLCSRFEKVLIVFRSCFPSPVYRISSTKYESWTVNCTKLLIFFLSSHAFVENIVWVFISLFYFALLFLYICY